MSMRHWSVLVSVSCCLLAALTPAFASGATERLSVSSAEAEGNDCSAACSISADGSYVAFCSDAGNLVEGDSGLARDVFVRDRLTGDTERVSVSPAGAEGNDVSQNPSISADGRYVAFASRATNLVEGDTNGVWDVFVRDRELAVTERVSVSSTGAEGDADSYNQSISADGRYVAFESWATDLVEGDTNGWSDVFVHDRVTGETERISVNSSEEQTNIGDSTSPSISADGSSVAFVAIASNLVPGDANGTWDIFVRDRDSGTTERVSVSSAEVEADWTSYGPSISWDARYVAFYSDATNLVAGVNNGEWHIFVRDRLAGTTQCASVSPTGVQGNGSSLAPSISADGRHVAFHSGATNLVLGDTNGMRDVFVRDRLTGTTRRVSVSSAGVQGDLDSASPSIAADSGCVAFVACATNLVPDDTNGWADVFVRSWEQVPVPEVLLEVHPNERAPGAGTNQYLGKVPWTQPTSSPAGSYWWKKYEFAAHGPLWIQLCAQNWDKTQKGYGDHDDTQLQFPLLGPLIPVDYDGIQSGAAGTWQWAGGMESGKRVTLRFLVPCTPGKQVLWIGADESPVLWWLKVIDLEPGVIEAF